MTIHSKSMGLLCMTVSLILAPGVANAASTTELLGSAKTICTARSSTMGACSAAVAAYIAQLKAQGLTPAVFDDELAKLVVALAGNTSRLPPAAQAVVSAVLREEVKFNDPQRQALMASITNDVAAGRDVQTVSIGGSVPPSDTPTQSSGAPNRGVVSPS